MNGIESVWRCKVEDPSYWNIPSWILPKHNIISLSWLGNWFFFFYSLSLDEYGRWMWTQHTSTHKQTTWCCQGSWDIQNEMCYMSYNWTSKLSESTSLSLWPHNYNVAHGIYGTGSSFPISVFVLLSCFFLCFFSRMELLSLILRGYTQAQIYSMYLDEKLPVRATTQSIPCKHYIRILFGIRRT